MGFCGHHTPACAVRPRLECSRNCADSAAGTVSTHCAASIRNWLRLSIMTSRIVILSQFLSQFLMLAVQRRCGRIIVVTARRFGLFVLD